MSDIDELDCYEIEHDKVDFELRAGLIEPWQARQRHQEIDQEASGNFDG